MNLDFTRVFSQTLPLLFEGTKTTITIALISIFAGLLVGFISCLMGISKNPVLRAISKTYVWIIRGTPMIVQAFFVFYAIPQFFPGVVPTPYVSGIVTLTLNAGAYLSEIIRGGIQAVPVGQTEAARSLGLSSVQTMRHIILPQAIRNILPPIANEFVVIIKESAVCWTIGVQEIMYAVNSTKGATYRIAEPLIIATLLYFCLCFPTSKIIAYFERRMSRGSKR